MYIKVGYGTESVAFEGEITKMSSWTKMGKYDINGNLVGYSYKLILEADELLVEAVPQSIESQIRALTDELKRFNEAKKKYY